MRSVHHYEALGISNDSSIDEIRLAYLAAARVSHPDLHDDDEAGRLAAENRMRELNLAWECLSDPTRRAHYDTSLHTEPDVAPWRPYDPSPDPEFDERHDRPITTGGLPGWLRLAPVLAFLVGLTCIILGGFIGLNPIVAVGFFSLLASVALFVVAPLVALTSSSRATRSDEGRW
jgi:hypothetical protein